MDAIKEAMIRAEDNGDNEEDAAFVRAALQADIDALEDRMLRLEWRLGEMLALTQGDIDQLRITPTPTRLAVMDECRDLLGLKGR